MPFDNLEYGLTSEAVAKRLAPKKAARTAGGWKTACPAHDDQNPSLSVSTAEHGGLLVKCHAGCSQDAVVSALAREGIVVSAPRNSGADDNGNIGTLLKKGFRFVKAYQYCDEQGHLLYENVRLEIGHNGSRTKTFRQRRPRASGYIENLSGVRRVPYRLEHLAAAPDQDVHVCEGEKDADRLASLGLLATSIAAPSNCELGALKGRRVVYLHEDNDAAGKEKAAKLAAALAGLAAQVATVRYADGDKGCDVSDWLDGGNNLEALLVRCQEALDAPPETNPAELEFDDQITIDTHVDALVKGVLHPGDVAALYGPSGVGKTFAAIDLAYHLALNRSWHGRRVRQAAVLYVSLEGTRGLRHRMFAYRRHVGAAGRMLARLTVHTPLDQSEVGKDGEATIIQRSKALAVEAGLPVGLIVIDTLARAIAGDDENSAQDMAAFVGRMSSIARETGAAVLVVHHPGKDNARGMRGSTALFAACDAVIKITGNGNVREVATEKVKDGVIGPLFSYQLEPVSLGIDDDGDEITSCIIKVVRDRDKHLRRPDPNSPPGRALAELEELAIDGKAQVAQGHARAPEGAKLVTRITWRAACQAKRLSTGEEDAERKAFQRAEKTLLNANLIGHHGEEVWLLRMQCGVSQRGV